MRIPQKLFVRCILDVPAMSFFSCCDCREGNRMRAGAKPTGHACETDGARVHARGSTLRDLVARACVEACSCALCLLPLLVVWAFLVTHSAHTLSQMGQQGNRRHCAASASTFAPTAPAPFSFPRLLKEVDTIFTNQLSVTGPAPSCACASCRRVRAHAAPVHAPQCAPRAASTQAPKAHPPNLDGGCPRCLQGRRTRQAASRRGMCYMRWTARLCCGAH
jgi:hypothetical protein